MVFAFRFVAFFSLFIVFFSVLVFASPSNNPNFVSKVGFVDTVDRVLKSDLSVFGTEYVSGSSGKVFLQVVYNDSAVNNAVCHLSIFNPDGSVWRSGQLMSYINDSDGLYFYDFIVPSVEGVYPVSASCEYYSSTNHFFVDSFVSDNLLFGVLNDLLFVDDSFVEFREIPSCVGCVDSWNLSVDFFFDNVSFKDSTSSLDFGVLGFSSVLLNISVFNFDSGVFELLDNKFDVSYISQFISNTISSNFSSYVNSSNSSILRVELFNRSKSHLDLLSFSFFKDNGADLSSYVSVANDSSWVESNIDGLGRSHIIDVSGGGKFFTNESFVDFRVAPKDDNQVGKWVYIHNLDGSVLYNSFLINTSREVFGDYRVQLANITGLVDKVYLSDLSQGGDMKLFWDFISVEDFSYRDSFFVDKVFFEINGFDSIPYNTKGSGEVHISNEPLLILDGLDYLSVQLNDNTSMVLSAISDLSFNASGDSALLLDSLVNLSLSLNNSWFGWYSDLLSNNFLVQDLVSNLSVDLDSYYDSLFTQHNFTQDLLVDVNGSLSDSIYRVNQSLSSEFNFLFDSFNVSVFGWYSSLYSELLSLSGDLDSYHGSLNSSVGSLSGAVDSLSGDLDSYYGSLNSRVDVLEGKIDDLDFKIDLLLEKFNVVTDDLNLEVVSKDCLEGSVWSIDVMVYDYFKNYLNNEVVSCNVSTDLWGDFDLVWDGDSFVYSRACGYGSDIVNWVVYCERI